MLYIPDPIYKQRRALLTQMQAGALTQTEAFQKALELDPYDFLSLLGLGAGKLAAGDLAAAEEYLWRAATSRPPRYEPWFALTECFRKESGALQSAVLALAAAKALRDPIAVENLDEKFKVHFTESTFEDTEPILSALVVTSRESRADEPADVTARLRKHRLIDDLLEAASEGLNRELVDAILSEGSGCTDLLMGVLRDWAGGLADSEDDPSAAVCSLALLGEIGDPALIPELSECLGDDDERIEEAARWAIERMAGKEPAVVFDQLRKLSPAGDAGRRGELAVAASIVGKVPGIREFLASLLDGMERFEKTDRHGLFMAVALSLDLTEGSKGREVAWGLLRRHAKLLPKRTRGELRDVFKLREQISLLELENGKPPAPTIYEICGRGFEETDEDGLEKDEDDDWIEDEDEDDVFEDEPVIHHGELGRNDPCWCGSGKKYKKCHLESDEKARPQPRAAEPLPPPQSSPEEAELRRRLIDFTVSSLNKREFEQTFHTFVGEAESIADDDDSLHREILDWLMHDYVSPRLGRTMIAEFLRRSPGGLTMRERLMLEGWDRARFSIFEVQEVRPGSGVRVKDLLAGGEFFVDDVSTARRAVLWDCFMARIEPLGGKHVFTAIVLTVPRDLIATLKEWADMAQRESGLDWEQFLRRNSHRLRQEYARLTERERPLPRMLTVEGDEVVFSRGRYKMLDERAVRDALDASPEFDSDDGGYVWLDIQEDERGGRRSYGRVSFDGEELILETQSRQRLERGGALLRQLAGAHLQHLGDDFTSVASAMRERQRTPQRPRDERPSSEDEKRFLQQFYDDHYRTWPDTPLPALDGKTPRDAAASAEGREKLIELLKLMENAEQRSLREGQPSYGISKLRAELGI